MDKDEYKVVIPTAGLGSRLQALSQNVNKSLVSVGNRPVLSLILDRFPDDVEFVIPVGYLRDTVIDFLSIAYPDRRFNFVDVDLFEGEGSGLGYTLLKCESALQCPFVFCSNDTIVLETIPRPDTNWMAYANLDGDVSQYRCIGIEGSHVSEIVAKGTEGHYFPYIGLAGIHDFGAFWDGMHAGGEIAISVGESYGLRSLLPAVEAREFSWFDTGNLEALENARNSIPSPIEANILEKEEEAIWFVGDRVIKFSTDHKFIQNRAERAGMLQPYVPEVIVQRSKMYAYRLVPGNVMSRGATPKNFLDLLRWLEGFWRIDEGLREATPEFRDRCMAFYRDKTAQRVIEYFARFEELDQEETINDREAPRIKKLLELIDWDWISKGTPVPFHGDLHFENILKTDDGFMLLDWRQDFGGSLEEGDLYYDLAKLHHGLIVSHDIVDANQFRIHRDGAQITVDIDRRHLLVQCERILRRYVIEKGLDWHKTQVMTALIFLNIAALHHHPYSIFLFYLGKSMLLEALDG